MPLPLLIGAFIAGKTGYDVATKISKSTVKNAKAVEIYSESVAKVKRMEERLSNELSELGRLELDILQGFDSFADVVEKIQQRPDFKEIKLDRVNIPKIPIQEFRKISVSAKDVIKDYSQKSGWIVFGSMCLGIGTVGAIGGALFIGSIYSGFGKNVKLLEKSAQEAMDFALQTEYDMRKIVYHLYSLSEEVEKFRNTIEKVKNVYDEKFSRLKECVVNTKGYGEFGEADVLNFENCVMLVQLLRDMCRTSIITEDKDGDGLNTINKNDVNKIINKSDEVLKKVA